MSKKILSFFIVLILTFLLYANVKASKHEALASSSNVLYDDSLKLIFSDEITSDGQFYVPEHWTSKIHDVHTYDRKLVDEYYFKRYRPLFYWNYHRIQAYDEGYKDTYVTSKILGIRSNGGYSTYSVDASTEISKTTSHNIQFEPEMENVKIGGFSQTDSTTVSHILGSSWTINLGPTADPGYYGFYTISNRTKYSIRHWYSESSKKYDLLYHDYYQVYMFESNKPDIMFLYTGSSSLA
jgi:hypothetical protein